MNSPPLPPTASVLKTALVSDALDAIGWRGRCLPPELSPLELGNVLLGRAFPATVVRVDRAPEDATTADEIASLYQKQGRHPTANIIR